MMLVTGKSEHTETQSSLPSGLLCESKTTLRFKKYIQIVPNICGNFQKASTKFWLNIDHTLTKPKIRRKCQEIYGIERKRKILQIRILTLKIPILVHFAFLCSNPREKQLE